MGLIKNAWIGKTRSQHFCSKRIKQYDLNGNFIKEWNCVLDAADMFSSISKRPAANIGDAARLNKRKTAFGYIWKYAD